MQNKKRVTIYDIAKALGISGSYISKALNDHPSISTMMKNKIQGKASELGYIHNSNAANLRKGKTRTIGVIVPNINKSFFSEAISGIEDVCALHNHSAIICQTHESFEREKKMIDLLIRQNVDCILISVSAETKTGDHLTKALQSKIEVLQFDRFIENLDCFRIMNNDFDSAEQLTEGLIARGFTKIAFMGGPNHSSIFAAREQGYRKAIEKYSLAINEEWIVRDILEREAASEVLKKWLHAEERPDAVIAVADQQALATLETAKKIGLRIPDDLGIVSFGNEDYTRITSPTLSSVNQKSNQIGIRAAEAYFYKLKHGNFPSDGNSELVNSEIIWRESTG